MKIYGRNLLISWLLILPVFAIAQERDISVSLALNEINQSRGTGREIVTLKEVQIWCAGKKPDSVLWAVRYGSKGETECGEVPALQVLTRRTGKSGLEVCILQRYNPFLKKEVVHSYVYDSLKKWKKSNYPESAVPRTVIDLPFCNGKQTVFFPSEMYFYPFNTGVSYPDSCLNEMPLGVSLGKSGVVKMGDDSIFILKRYYTAPDHTISMKVKENGVLQQDLVTMTTRLVYKNIYRWADTLVIGEKLYKVDSISGDWQTVYMRQLKEKRLTLKMPEKYMRQLEPYFKNAEEYLLLDFWGTWCKPCIAGMPDLRALHDKVKTKVPFVSVCFDDPEKYARAEEIFRENKLTWPQIFCNMKDRKYTMVGELSVTTFPTYMLVSKSGEIFFSASSGGFDELSGILQGK